MARAGSALLCAAAILAVAPGMSNAAGSPFGKPAVADERLAGMRGGFELPTGLVVNMAVVTSTSVNGAPVLQTMFVANNGAPTLTILANTGAAGAGDAAAAAGPAGDAATIGSGSTNTISVGTDPASTPAADPGLTVVNPEPGQPVDSAAGAISLQQTGEARQIVLSNPTLEVRHLAGQAYGSIISNSANNVTIDTVTVLNLEIHNASMFNLGSALMRLDTLSSDAAIRLVR